VIIEIYAALKKMQKIEEGCGTNERQQIPLEELEGETTEDCNDLTKFPLSLKNGRG